MRDRIFFGVLDLDLVFDFVRDRVLDLNFFDLRGDLEKLFDLDLDLYLH